MMKCKARKTVCALLALLTALSAAACSAPAGDASSPQANSSEGSAASDASGGDTSSEKVTFPLAEPITFSVFVKNDDTATSYTDNWVTDWVKEQTNVTLEFIEAGGEEAETKLNLIMAGGENLPDFFLATGWSKAQTMMYASEQMIIPLNEYLKDAENWNRLNEESPMRESDLIFPDGNYYSYGFDNEAFHMNYQAKIWYYKPWLDELNGGKIPETTDEFYEYLKKVKESDPNGNGQADEIPLSGHIQGGSGADPLTFLTNAFLENNNQISGATVTPGRGFIVNDGKIEFQLNKEEYRDALTYLRKLNQEGLLDPQAFTQAKDDWKALFLQDVNTVAVATNYNYPCGFDSDPEGAWTNWVAGTPLQGPDGVQLSAYYADNYFHRGMGIVSADCERPDVAVALMDWLASDENSLTQTNGPKGIFWDFTDSGTSVDGGQAAWKNLKIEQVDENGNPDLAALGLSQKYHRWSIDGGIIAATNRLRLSMGVEDPEIDLESHLYSISKEYEKYAPDLDTIVPSFAYTEEESTLVADASVAVMTYANQSTVDFVTGVLSLENDWDGYVAKLDELGLPAFLELMQKKYDEIN